MQKPVVFALWCFFLVAVNVTLDWWHFRSVSMLDALPEKPDLSWTVSSRRLPFIHLSFSTAVFHLEAVVFANRSLEWGVFKLVLALIFVRRQVHMLCTWFVHDHRSTNQGREQSWILKSLCSKHKLPALVRIQPCTEPNICFVRFGTSTCTIVAVYSICLWWQFIVA